MDMSSDCPPNTGQTPLSVTKSSTSHKCPPLLLTFMGLCGFLPSKPTQTCGEPSYRIFGEFGLNNHQLYANLKNMKKRESDRVCRDDDSKGKQKYQILFQDYLELQKEFVSRKKKLEAAITKRGLLEAEVRFLKRRYRYMSTLQFAEAEIMHDANAYDKPVINERRNHIVNEKQKHMAKAHGVAKDVRWDALKRSKKPKNCLVNRKAMAKSKNSWQDPLALRV